MSLRRSLILSFLLTIPVILFVIHHYTRHSADLHPTGFTNSENVLYMSYAHQYLDQQPPSLFYSNPFDGDPNSARIYFQPVNFLFAACLKTGIDPGMVFTLFGLIMAFGTIYLGVRILHHLIPEHKYFTLVTVLFTWGGGLTAITGLASAFVSGTPTESWIDGIYLADPANGWWALNWGRNLFIPLEAWYHFLFLLNIYLVLKRKWTAATLAVILLSFSHPFTGIEYLSIIIGWLSLEKIFFKNKNIPYWFAGTMVGIAILHAWYYLIYLNQFEEHRQLFSQYSASWTYSFRVFIPAYALVFLLVAANYWRNKPLFKFLYNPNQRLFLCWTFIAFLLSKHEWFMRPMQPIHFTRGYVWAGLFLLGIPGLLWLIEYLRKNNTRRIILVAGVLLFLCDNILWIGNHLRGKEHSEWEGYLKKNTIEVFNYLAHNSSPNDLIVGHASLINYMANVYTPANAWVSHPYNTPAFDQRMQVMTDYLKTGIPVHQWTGRRLLIVINKQQQVEVNEMLKKNKLFENDSYLVVTP